MIIISKTRGDERPLKFELDLSQYNKTVDEVVDIVCTIKSTVDESNNARFNKSMASGDITLDSDNIISVNMTNLDYNKFVDDTQYLLGCFVRFDGDVNPDQHVVQKFYFKVEKGIYS